MAKRYSVFLAVMSVLLVSHLRSNAESRKNQENASRISVRLQTTKRVISPGESLELRVEVWNEGLKDVFVGKDFYEVGNSICRLELFMEDLSGRRYESAIGSAGEYFPDAKESFASALVRDWVTLPPGNFYGRMILLTPGEFPVLRKPGRYRIGGRYISGGLRASLYFNTLRAHPEEIDKLPYKGWEGEVETNSVWIEIVPAKKNGQKKK